jgi:hypothetical protein
LLLSKLPQRLIAVNRGGRLGLRFSGSEAEP